MSISSTGPNQQASHSMVASPPLDTWYWSATASFRRTPAPSRYTRCWLLLPGSTWEADSWWTASTTLLARVADEFICELLVGLDLTANADDFVEEVRRCYHGHAQKAIIAAFRDLHGRYHELREPRRVDT